VLGVEGGEAGGQSQRRLRKPGRTRPGADALQCPLRSHVLVRLMPGV
jgi:hypothetical protein